MDDPRALFDVGVSGVLGVSALKVFELESPLALVNLI